MQPELTPNSGAPSEQVSLFRRLLRHPVRLLAFLFVCFITAVVLFYEVTHLLGKREWENYKQQLKAKGEWVEAESVIPPPVPDDQNFAMTPFLAPLLDFLPGTQKVRDTNAAQRISETLKLPSFQNKMNPLEQDIDLKGWANAFVSAGKATVSTTGQNDRQKAAMTILSALRPFEPIFTELEQASHRPFSRFNIAYRTNIIEMQLPHLSVLRQLCSVLQLRASAALAVGRTEEAFKDVQLMFYLADSIKEEPTLISCLVRLAAVKMALQPVWEGLAHHQWSEAQLQWLQNRLEKFDIIQDGVRGIKAERDLCGASVAEMLRQNPAMIGQLDGHDGPVRGELLAKLLVPTGWLYLEQMNFHKAYTEHVLPSFDIARHRVDPKASRDNQKHFDELMKDKFGLIREHRLLTALFVPSVVNVAKRAAESQTTIDLALVACGLERYRASQGQFPSRLADLAPQYCAKIPHDVITGEPLKYRLIDNGRFILYSVGWNQTDDGGTVVRKKDSARPDIEQGDWVWHSVSSGS